MYHPLLGVDLIKNILIIGPKSDHWLPLPVTNQLTPCCLVDLIDVTLACEDANLKLIEVVTVAHVDAENVLTTVWCRFGG